MSEIKRCPFCGWYASVKKSEKDNGYRVRCNNCGTKTVKYKTSELAVGAWNTRKPMQNIVERLEKLESDSKEDWANVDDEQSFGEYKAYGKAAEIVKEESGLYEKTNETEE